MALGLVAAVAGAQTADGTGDRRAEVVLEGGVVSPLGDLAAGYLNTERGMGQEPGYTLGLRVRLYAHRNLTLAPTFAYVEFGDYDGYDAGGKPFSIQTSLLRYGLDVCWIATGGERTVRPFAGVGAAVVRNKYGEEFTATETVFDAGRNAFTWSLQSGFRILDWEVTFQYEFDRFTTPAFHASGEDLSLSWNNLIVRVGLVLPRL